MTMTKKSVQSFCYWVRLIGLSSWFNISPHRSTNKYSSCRWASRGRSSWFCFSLWSACKSKYIRFQRKCFRLRLRGLLLVVVVLLVDQVRDQFIQAMRNSDRRERIVFVYRFNSDFHSMFTLQVTGCDFQYGSNFGVPLNLTFRVSWIFHLVAKCTPDMSLFCKLWELVSVLCHEVLSDFNCFQESCINTNLYHSILLWKTFHSFFVLLHYIFLCKNFNRRCRCRYQ